AYYKQEKYEDAIKSFQSALEVAKDNDRKAKAYHNIGNSLLKNNKIEQSIEAYKNALKYNPDDSDTKYNLSYALELLKNQNKDQQNKNDKDNKDKNKQDQQQQQNQSQEQKDNAQNKQDQQQLKDQESKQDNTKQQQPKEEKISKEEAQRILDALKNSEKDLQKQLRKKSGRIKKTDKDW
ncbi:MAG: tetratricopeptide repeat protein, partial [Ignavibacteriaceae bacterium]